MDNKHDDNILEDFYALLTNVDSPLLKDLLIKKCEELNISQRKLSGVIGIERKSLQRILDGEAQKIDIVTFLKLSQFLKIDINNLMQIYLSKLTPNGIKDIEDSRKASFILHNFDLDVLKKQNFIKDKTNYIEIEERIKHFFGLNSIFEYIQFAQAAFFSRVKRSHSDKMLGFWISLVYYQIKRIENPNPYNRELLKSIIPKLRGLTKDENTGLKRAALSLYEAGITIVCQSYLSKTSVRGATFINNGKPYIVLTDHNKRYDSLWFSLIHELYHVLQDFKQIQKLSYHLTGESDLFIDNLAEEYANDFARELLFPIDKLNYIKDFIDIPAYIEEYSIKSNVHPSIIYGFYLFDKESNEEYKKYQKYLLKSDTAIKTLLIDPWTKENVEEISNQINKIYKPKIVVKG